MTHSNDILDGWDLPASWTPGARDVFAGVLQQRPDLAGAELSSLEQAAALHSMADQLEEAAVAEGLLATGSAGQRIVHPGVTEARLARTSAAAILARLVPINHGGAMTASARGRDAARKRWAAS
ncbi:hypothetical protein I6E68_05935 [Salinibacterium sp. NSLL150]|uniref:hypothetical protein n=1 Tax=unclassified Salinibacterium TaxID=2632331 RepID=UPI0018CE8416|nr:MULTISPECIES: hypothetical protein [unclassified Salinibacterium]MBH0098680.1 hypothetical protein [Salinibacterium sp. NSLL35]MBH0101435.1 hypothetical protein [Salinibacterium sp. NSLL150]MBH0104194.1 hypothetical protein [Salinibacterium sp. NSLL16]MBH0106955.1 hypothetical protein [Salinibacterium sp. NSLL17]